MRSRAVFDIYSWSVGLYRSYSCPHAGSTQVHFTCSDYLATYHKNN